MDAEALPTLPELTKALGVGASPARRWGLPAGLALGVAVAWAFWTPSWAPRSWARA